MKKLFAFIFIFALLFIAQACRNNTAWEYKTVFINDLNSSVGSNQMYLPDIPNFDEKLNELGKQGWELVGIYELIGTLYPNFGDEKYHTGIKENTKTMSIRCVFKREVENP